MIKPASVPTQTDADFVSALDSIRQSVKADFYRRQISGSVNYRTGSDVNDFMHGFLNYQIEHHLWPDMTMLQYKKAQPMVKAIALKYSIPYVQQSVWKRLGKTVSIMVGRSSMQISRLAPNPPDGGPE